MDVLLRNTRLVIVVAVLLSSTLTALAQTSIGGVVNKYVTVTEVIPCDSLVRVGNQLTLKAGDRVLLVQMKGAKISSSNDPNFGTITDIASAGAYEFLTIKEVIDDSVIFTSAMVHAYDPSGIVQLVYVPVYASARITSTLTAPQWNGTTGGIVAIEVAGDLTMDADIKVDGLGFRGGRLSSPYSRCDVSDYLLNWDSELAGEKGEGITALRVNYSVAGRGPLANGGGGGNGNNSGGAGGSNGGTGGGGGDANMYCRVNMSVGGIGGASLTPYITDQRVFFGGGGGGAHQNDRQGTSGTNGGGIVIIKATTVHGNYHEISANGLDVTELANMDAAGGGGAGGTVVLDVTNVASPLQVFLRGGDGGSIEHLYNAHGPGGGGGGGILVTSRPLSNINVDLRGGSAGLHTIKSNEAYGDSRNADKGTDGAVITSFTWKVPATYTLEIWGGGAVCQNISSVQMEATPGYARYTWSDGQTGRVITVGKPGTYSVVAVDSSGCQRTATGVTVWTNPTQFTLPSSLDFAAVPFESTKWMTLQFENTDDEEITIERFENSQNFRVISPLPTPTTIAPGTSMPIVVEFYAIEDRTFNEKIRVFISAPCPDSQDVSLHAVVSPIWATFRMPDTTAQIGDTSFAMPLYVYVTPDTTILENTHLRVNVTMDSRLFSPTGVTNGRIVGNMIDVITNTRTLTIEIDSINLYGLDNLVTSIKGSALLSTVTETPIYSADAEWLRVWQQPITDHEGGSLEVDQVCFQYGRAIKLIDMPTMKIAPNPASDVVQISTRLSAAGVYSVEVYDILGNRIHGESLTFAGTTSEDHTIVIDAAPWAAGTYAVVYTTPLVAFTDRVTITR